MNSTPFTPPLSVAEPTPLNLAIRRFSGYAGILAVLFCVPLARLVSMAFKRDLYSHVPLMPVLCFYLVWVTRHRLPRLVSPSRLWALVLAGIGLVSLLVYVVCRVQRIEMAANDSLALVIGAFVCFLFAAAFLVFGWGMIRVVALPAVMMIFVVPFPTVIENGLETFLQQGSAEATDWLFKLTTVPVHREGVIFALPGITIKVAEECSGIRSSLVLFITALIAGHMFLEKPWHRFWFSLIAIPLGIIRNGLRVVVISMLCVCISPEMIHSPIHHRGGPIFFVISLIPLFGILVLFRKAERKKQKEEIGGAPASGPTSQKG